MVWFYGRRKGPPNQSREAQQQQECDGQHHPAADVVEPNRDLFGVVAVEPDGRYEPDDVAQDRCQGAAEDEKIAEDTRE